MQNNLAKINTLKIIYFLQQCFQGYKFILENLENFQIFNGNAD